MNTNGKILLLLGAGLNFGIALLHVAIIIAGAPGYLYFGTADLAILAVQGSPIPALLTGALVIIFAAFGFYALSGAGLIRRLPLLTLGLIGIGGIYTLRGLIVIPDSISLVRGADYPFRQTAFSAVALSIGILYLVGAVQRWRYLRARRD